MHKVFISYHHAEDQYYRNLLEQEAGISFVSRSVGMGDIDSHLRTETIRQRIRDEYLRDSTVTIVLVGARTWQRKHVDWEIGSSIRHTEYNHRSGLLGLILPTHPFYEAAKQGFGRYKDYYRTIPPRLHDNFERGYAKYYFWPGWGGGNDGPTLEDVIDTAFRRRHQDPPPDNSYPSFGNNRSGAGWHD